jgi:hypothetical protein
MQQPSWVCPPSLYIHGSASSLSVAFEDPSGEKLKALLAERYLFLFGNKATVKKWKYRRPATTTKDPSPTDIIEHPQDDEEDDDQDVKSEERNSSGNEGWKVRPFMQQFQTGEKEKEAQSWSPTWGSSPLATVSFTICLI